MPRPNLRDRLLVLAQAGDTEAGDRLVGQVRLRDLAIDAAPVPQLVVDAQGNVALANQSVRSCLV